MYYRQEDWIELGINTCCEQMFYSIIKELVNQKTYISWQYRYSNTLTILDELADAVSLLQHTGFGYRYTQTLLDEIESTFKRDNLNKLYDNTDIMLSELRNLFQKGAKDTSVEKQELKKYDEILSCIELLKGIMGDYVNKIKAELERLMLDDSCKEKKYLITLCNQYITHIIANGYSWESVEKAIELLEDNTKLFRERVVSFFNYFNFSENEFRILFLTSTLLPEIETETIRIYKNNERRNLSSTEQDFYEQNKSGKNILEIKVNALNAYEAKNKAEVKKDTYFGVKKFYEPKIVNSNHAKILIYDKLGSPSIQEKDSSYQNYLFNSTKISANMKKFLNLDISDSDLNKISTSLHYHNIAMESTNDTTRLVNMWIALESLIEGSETIIIERICRYTVPTNVTRYIFNLCLAIGKELRHMALKEGEFQIGNIAISSDVLRANNILEILFTNENVLEDDLYVKLKHNTLLRFKIYDIIESIFKDAKKLHSRLNEHKKHIDWQLRRIYKVRNLIMHNGIDYKRLKQLSFHLHNYYIQLVHNLLYDLKAYPRWSIQTALKHRELTLSNFLNILDNSPDKLTLEMLIQPDLIYVKTVEGNLWKK